MGQVWSPDHDQRPEAASAKPQDPKTQAWTQKRQATSSKPHYNHIHMIIKRMRKKYWLLDYFTQPNDRLSKSYVKKVERFLKCLKKKQVRSLEA